MHTKIQAFHSIQHFIVNWSAVLAYVILWKIFVCFVALRPKSTAMVMAGRSVHLTTLFPGQA